MQMSHRLLCPAHRDRHGRTTEALTLLILIGIPLENTKSPEPHTVVSVEAPTPSLKEAGLPSTSGIWKSWVTECCARFTGGSHGRITDAPEQRFNSVNLREML